eukprot:1155150-Pelagomonas_calceolata.AAC.11
MGTSTGTTTTVTSLGLFFNQVSIKLSGGGGGSGEGEALLLPLPVHVNVHALTCFALNTCMQKAVQIGNGDLLENAFGTVEQATAIKLIYECQKVCQKNEESTLTPSLQAEKRVDLGPLAAAEVLGSTAAGVEVRTVAEAEVHTAAVTEGMVRTAAVDGVGVRTAAVTEDRVHTVVAAEEAQCTSVLMPEDVALWWGGAQAEGTGIQKPF